jgi:hypothetical protein
MAVPDSPQMKIRGMRLASWIPKAIDTCSKYEKLIALPRQQWLRERNLMLSYTYTGYTQQNGAVLKVNKKFISHLSQVQRTPSTAETV